jgi:hypothetical protein
MEILKKIELIILIAGLISWIGFCLNKAINAENEFKTSLWIIGLFMLPITIVIIIL